MKIDDQEDNILNERNGQMFKTRPNHQVGRNRLWSAMERDGLRHATLLKTRKIRMTTTQRIIPDRSSPRPRTTSSVGQIHQDGGRNCATSGSNKTIRARNKIVIGTWNVQTFREAGKFKFEQLEYEMNMYKWNILSLCEVRMKHF
ncbi:hypothetical protein ElyMa_007038400 [Elysia marginata]|uniref:Craniofacial development protein 2-like n=1 Tax=Elysia marginata TaxID=1093978 RepID=A0AAV4JW27_9GAST|nr:hypothetical protein ElyMa_007038400 [Elysia marginata]